LNNALNHHIKSTRVSDHLIIGTVVASIILHVLATIVIPNIRFDPVVEKKPLKIELVKLPEPVAEEPKPIEPPKPIVKKLEPKKPDKPKPIQKVVPKPAPIVMPEVTPVPPPSVEPETKVIAVTPKPEAPPNPVPPVPVVTAPPPPPPPQGPSEEDISNARDVYKNALWSSIAKHKKYPRIAQMRGWQGEVMLELSIDGNGKLLNKQITKSSGYNVLDEEALNIVEKAVPFDPPPEVLKGTRFTIKLGIPFKLIES